MVDWLVTAGVVLCVAAAEAVHARRMRRVATLAFGPTGQAAVWARSASLLRVAACGALAWGLTTLCLLEPKTHRSGTEIPDSEKRRLLIVLDVSPSMRLRDAGPELDQSRLQRVRGVMESMFARLGIRQYLLTVVATYNGAIPIVENSRDPEVVRNILNDLPLHYAFPKGDTDLFAGLEEVARISRPWPPQSATLLVISDGDTIPATGLPKLPPAIAHKLVVGVGDPRTGTFIDGRNSRQEASILRQLAIRLGGVYHDGNTKELPSDLLRAITKTGEPEAFEWLTRREYALAACLLGAMTLAFLPPLLSRWGTAWRPGVQALGTDA